MSKDNVFSEENEKELKEETLTAVAFKLISKFEWLLTRKNITIPNDEREGKADEARIFGTDYYDLEEEIKEVLQSFDLI